ncbi:GNAT family N-acetyltransferase [Polaromonas sp. YR568]|uniref:GNAT family N-acetyltransferase n=1 Tax=Polaromonas sp. YR568 TaxID=1855301 RepID=UPI003138384D
MTYTVSREPYTLDIHGLQVLCLPGDAPLPDNPRNHYWVARAKDGEAVAFVILYRYQDCWYLSRAGTLERHSGKHLYPRLLRAAFRHIRKTKTRNVITDCSNWNTRSANGLIRAGFRLYTPARKWGFEDGLYWTLDL